MGESFIFQSCQLVSVCSSMDKVNIYFVCLFLSHMFSYILNVNRINLMNKTRKKIKKEDC